MSDPQRLPEALRLLSQELDSPGPALPQSEADARNSIRDALAEAARTSTGAPSAAAFNSRAERTRRSHRLRQVAVAAVVLGVGSAAAAWVQRAFFSDASEPPPTLAPRAAQVAPAANRANPTTAPTTDAGAPSGSQAERTLIGDGAAPARSPRLGERGAPTAPQDLLAEANSARRKGDLARAESLYLRVVSSSPGSSAAYVARVAVAKLRLSDRPSSSVELLRSARTSTPAGPLEQEICQSLARAYRALGQPGNEQRELSRLLERYPNSVGAKTAKSRLKQLKRD